jgi:acyl-CoA dehydrogenase
MDFECSGKTQGMMDRLESFMQSHVLPANQEFHGTWARGEYPVALLDRLKAMAFSEGLWNMFMPELGEDDPGTRLTNLECAPLAEIMGRVRGTSSAALASGRGATPRITSGRTDSGAREPIAGASG